MLFQLESKSVWVKSIIGLVAVVLLAAGTWMIWDYYASIPPNPGEDDPDRVLAFLVSDHFNRLSEVEQRRYMQTMRDRYVNLDAEQRREADAAIARLREEHGDALRERMFAFWKRFVITEAQTYVELPPEERGVWLDRRIAMWQGMGMPRDGRGDRERERPTLTPERQARAVQFYQEEILPRSSARERALVAILMSDVMERVRQ